MKYLLKISICLVICFGFMRQSLGQDGNCNSTAVTFVNVQSTINAGFSLNSFTLRYCYSTLYCGKNVKITLTVPEKINISTLQFSENSVVTQSPVTTNSVTGQKSVELTIKNLPPPPQGSISGFTNSTLTISSGLSVSLSRDCNSSTLSLNASIEYVDDAGQSIPTCPKIIATPASISVVVPDAISGYVYPVHNSAAMFGTNSKEVFFFDFQVSKGTSYTSLYNEVDFEVTLNNKSVFTPIRVTRIRDNNGDRFNKSIIGFENTTNGITFKDNEFGTFTGYEIYYRVYFNVTCTTAQSLSGTVKLTPITACTGLNTDVVSLPISTQSFPACSSLGTRLDKPYVLNEPPSFCANQCGTTGANTYKGQLDNTFGENSFTNARFDFDIPGNIRLTSLSFEQLFNISTSTPSYLTPSVSYLSCGATGDYLPLTAGNYGSLSSLNISKLRFTYTSFPKQTAGNFEFKYSVASGTCSSQTSGFSITPTFSHSTLITPVSLSSVNLNVAGTSCYDLDYYTYTRSIGTSSTGLGVTYNEKFFQDNEMYAMIRMQNLSNLSLDKLGGVFYVDTRTATSRNFLIADNEPVKFYYGPSSEPIAANFGTASSFPALSELTYVLDAAANKITLSGLNLPSSCGSVNYIFVLIKVKAAPRALAGSYSNSYTFTTAQTGRYIVERNYPWIIGQSEPNVSSTAQVSCGDGKFYNTSQIKKGQDFSFNLFLHNEGNAPLNQIKFFTTLPFEGDIRMATSFARGSTITLNNSCTNIIVKELDREWKYVRTLASSEYNVCFVANTNGTLKDIPTFALPSPSNCPTCSQTSKQGIYVTTNSNYTMAGYTKLCVEIPATVPQTASLGNVGNLDCVVKVNFALSNVPSDNLPSDNVASFTVASSSSCDVIPPSCAECLESFYPDQGKKYVISAWVKQDMAPNGTTDAHIDLVFEGANSTISATPKGAPIEGWRLIETEVQVPTNASAVTLKLLNNSGGDAYFDDLRMHPFNASMKSFVYDPRTKKMVAELDERNYATYYEYDNEGQLVRVKKETERGIMTIQESRNNQAK